jgi:ribosomal protein S18 acetylase RimI-like enzyme
MDITYRPAKSEDLDPAARIVQQAYNDLRVRHGLAPTVSLRPPLFQAFCLAEDPDGLWVAEADEGIVGFGFSWMSQNFWFLSQLSIKPETQARGIGQALLSKTLRQAQRSGADNRALITLAYNTVSTGLYVRNGMYPREPLYRLLAPASVVAQNITVTDYDVAPIAPWPEPREWIGRIDEEILGFRRDSHHRFLLSGFAPRAVSIERARRPVGYGYISADGHVGPLAVAADADPKAVVASVVRCALDGRPKQVSMIVPGRADQILGAVSELGFRIDEPYVLMSALPFGDWRHYLPSNPGFM